MRNGQDDRPVQVEDHRKTVNERVDVPERVERTRTAEKVEASIPDKVERSPNPTTTPETVDRKTPDGPQQASSTPETVERKDGPDSRAQAPAPVQGSSRAEAENTREAIAPPEPKRIDRPKGPNADLSSRFVNRSGPGSARTAWGV